MKTILTLCCNEFAKEIEQDNTFCILLNKPFTKEELNTPAIYICNDGGHGGIFKIKYCPFCGAEIKIYQGYKMPGSDITELEIC